MSHDPGSIEDGVRNHWNQLLRQCAEEFGLPLEKVCELAISTAAEQHADLCGSMRTLEALASTFHELDGYTDDLVVPLVTRGTIDNYKTEIDPEFLVEAAAEIGLRHGFKELEKKTGVPIGDILDGLFGNKGKKKKP